MYASSYRYRYNDHKRKSVGKRGDRELGLGRCWWRLRSGVSVAIVLVLLALIPGSPFDLDCLRIRRAVL